MRTKASRMVCAGCKWNVPANQPWAFNCENVSRVEGVEHVLERVLDRRQSSWPTSRDANPFIRYRSLFHTYQLAMANSLSDAEYVDVVAELDDAVRSVDGRGFRTSPFAPSPSLTALCGESGPAAVWVKDETRSVGYSHKARHLFGIAIHLRVAERIGAVPWTHRTPLVISSCGNAAVAAAVIARAMGRELHVFVPASASSAVQQALRELGARVERLETVDGTPGDPCYRSLSKAIARGAIPFTCQGPKNVFAIEGGKTIAYEMVSELGARRAKLDRVVVQVGGGALASSLISGLREAVELGALAQLPRMDVVQTRVAHPLARAQNILIEQIGRQAPAQLGPIFDHAARHRAEFMWPWEGHVHSLATGILDEETYDWLAVLRGVMESRGRVILVSEDILLAANERSHKFAGVNASITGTAGFAGLMQRGGEQGEHTAVLLTGRNSL